MICSALRCGLSAVVWASVTAKTSNPWAAALRSVDAKVGGAAAQQQPVHRLFRQQEAELGVEEAVAGGLAYSAVMGARRQIGVQLPARAVGGELGSRLVVLHIDDAPLPGPHGVGQTIDVGDDSGVLMAGLLEKPLLHVDDQ